jgi:leucyl aminopeptidase (aminopeptidase T)
VRAGQWIKVPYGAQVTSPASVIGTYVADAAMSGALGARRGLLSARPVRLTIEAGRVRSVESHDAELKSYVEKFIAEGQNRDRVGLLNLGANVGIVAPIGELIHDEQMPGVHLALGEPMATQSGATWTAHGQLSFAMADADVDLDGVPLIRRGRYVRFV